MLKFKDIFPIAIGSWTIDPENAQHETEALKHFYSKGANMVIPSLCYNDGKVLDLIGSFVKTLDRNKVFINALITYGCNEAADVEKQLDLYLEKCGIKYVDCLTLHGTICIGFPLEECLKEMKRLKDAGKTRYLGVSNLSIEELKEFHPQFKFDYFEGMYNFECRINERVGILDYCKEYGIPFYAYQPLRRNRTAQQNYQLLVELANKYNKTQNQIILNWLIKHKGIGVLNKSSNKGRIDENFSSLDFIIEKADYKKMDEFDTSEFDNIPTTWGKEPDKTGVWKIPNLERKK